MRRLFALGLAAAALSIPAVARAEGLPEKDASGPLFDVSLGIPKLATDGAAFDFDARGGYRSEHVGGTLRLGTSRFVTDAGGTLAYTQRFRFLGDLFFRTGHAGDPTRFEFRLNIDASNYGTTYLTFARDAALAQGSFGLEASQFVRVTHFATVATRSERVSFTGGVGVGLQLEGYARLHEVGGGSEGGDGTLGLTLRFVGSARLRAEVWRDMFAVRAEGTIETFDLHRAALFVGNGTLGFQTETFRLVEASPRIFVEVLPATFFGIVPGAFGGLDVVNAAGSAGSVFSAAPLAGVGLLDRIE